jgi:hypothetical protein
MTLAETLKLLGDSGAADAIRRALAAHPTITAAAKSLGTSRFAFRRTAARLDIALPESPRTPGKGTSERTERRRRNAANQVTSENRRKK